jgi:hypothetical protein
MDCTLRHGDIPDGTAYAHFLPVIVELSTAVEADYVGSLPNAVGGVRFARWSERKRGPVVSATENRTK